MKNRFFVLLGVLIPMLTANCSDKKTVEKAETTEATAKTESVINVSKPPFQKFVVVTVEDEAEGTPLLKEPKNDSPSMQRWLESDCESDFCEEKYQWSDQSRPQGFDLGTDAIAGPGRVFPLLGEEGDYYKVSTLGKWCDIESAYILKSDVGEIEMKPITADMLEGDGEESSLTYRVMKDGKYKDIVIGYEYDELNGETLQVGLLRDGALVTPVTYMIDSQLNTELNDIEITESDGTFSLKYGQSLSVVTDEETNSRQLDIKKLSNKQIEKIIDTVTKKKPEYVECMYHFPAMGVRMFYYKTK
jgi:hypothetical protein